ncbi:MAG: type II toxin-antitoxin system RelE/ParE family toxin [Lachnospiraceae bacterium]|nr:type II toxin-antitoxin system RelE/ParE family toxin [Lachnospiraceae bacterium]
MFTIDFYEKNGRAQVLDFLEELRKKKKTDKNARIQYSQISCYIQLLSDNGTRGLPKTIAEYLGGDIWELRPGNNRVFFFFYTEEGKYVLLHQFRKKTQKTPSSELRKAKAERLDYLKQKEKKG